MARLLRTLWLMALILLVPVLPFLALGASFEQWLERWHTAEHSAGMTATAVVGLLSTDIFLPIPSSVISTLGGVRLGWLGGTLASWAGMTIGASLGFAIARRWGRPLALHFSRSDELDQMAAAQERYGAPILVIVRGVPVLAEASVLLAGISRMSWHRFLAPVMFSNFGIALAYSAFGDFAGRHQWLPAALAVAIALPVVLALGARKWVERERGARC